jgi:hypothetical protein
MNKPGFVSIFILSSILYLNLMTCFAKNGMVDFDACLICSSNELAIHVGLSRKKVVYISDNSVNPSSIKVYANDSLHKVSTVKVVQKIDDSDILNIEEFPSVYYFKSGMQIDADGAPKAYHKDSSMGLDHLKNAGKKGNWWGIVTINGKSGGSPTIQGSDDPAPGYYVAGTSLQDSTKEDADPDRYVDSAEVPYIALPSGIKFPVKTGDFGFVINTENNMTSGCVFADIGPRGKIGEGSIALAEAVGISSDPKGEGTKSKFVYILFSNSSMGWPLTVDFINTHSKGLFEQWGGMKRLKEVMP